MTEAELHYKKMTEKPLARLIVSLGIPTTISMLVTSIYNMADTYFVGILGESPQAATGILFTIQAAIQAIAFMLGQGSGTLVAKALADRNVNEASEYVSTSFFTALFCGSLFAILGLVFLEPLLMFLGSTKTILPYAKQYGACVLISCPIVMASFVLNNNLRYEGKALFSMFGLASGGIINIFGDWLLVYVYNFGVLGAGIATTVSQAISFVILYVFFVRKAQGKIGFKYISRNVRTYLSVVRVGLPALIRQGLGSLSSGILNNLTRPFGDAAIAAMSVVSRFSMFVMCVGLGIGQGYQPVASFNYQAKRYDRVKRGLLITMGIGTCCILCLSVPGFILSDKIIYLFQKESEVIRIGKTALRFACVGTTFLALSVPVNMLYQSTRQAGVASFLSLLRSGLLFIPLLVILTSRFGLFGIQLSQPLADVLTGLFSIPFMIHFLKKPESKMK
ncbi:MAG: MATE family efflux transporter [Oscillospiraceae bacterium]|nr:MATE family efflux transporter [Oscillospiraceae bacterium]